MRAKRSPGFTIIELMTVIVIVGILATFAAPNLREMVFRTRVKTAASDLHTSLMFARSEAVKRNATIDVVPTGGDWAQGWTVQVSGPATVLMTFESYDSIAVEARDAGTCAVAGATATVSFAGTGRSSATDSCLVFSVTGFAAIPVRCVVISPSGRPSVLLDKDSDSTDGCY